MAEIGEAAGEFSVMVPLTKVWQDERGEIWFEGVASSTRLDKQHERMTHKAIQGMSEQRGIPRLPSHAAGPLEELGTAEECWADNDQFRILGRLDNQHPEAQRLLQKVMGGRRYGLSVGGRVRRAFWRYDEEAGKPVRHIDEVELDHVAVCRPQAAANPDTYLAVLAKAAEPVTEDRDRSADSPADEGETDVLARIGRAAVQAARSLWPFGKSVKEECASGEEGPMDEDLSEVSSLRAQVEELVKEVGVALAELRKDTEHRDESAPAHGESQSLPGQESAVVRGGETWKGVL